MFGNNKRQLGSN